MTDQMGVVYYANYLELFEIGRTELLRARGLTYHDMETDGIFLPVVHAAADYLASARYDDRLEIRTWVERVSCARINFRYEIRREGEPDLLCRGVSHHGVVGVNGRPCRLDGRWIEALDPLRVATGR